VVRFAGLEKWIKMDPTMDPTEVDQKVGLSRNPTRRSTDQAPLSKLAVYCARLA
jgi:hypothetical protein